MAEESARYRKLYPRAWKSFRGLSLEEKAIAVYILTGDQTNRIGLFDFSIGKAIEELETLPQTFHKGFSNVIRTIDWEYDNVNRVLYISTWWKWNPPENPNVLKGNLKDLLEVAHSPLIAKFTSNTKHLEHSPNLLETFIQTFAERYPKPSPNQEQNQEQKQKQEQEQEDPPHPPFGGGVSVPLPKPFSPQDLARLWNEKAPPELRRVDMPFKRKPNDMEKIRDAVKRNPDMDWWERVVLLLHQLPFCRGQGDRGWKITFDVMVRDAEKILDGKYAGGKPPQPKSWGALKESMDRRTSNAA